MRDFWKDEPSIEEKLQQVRSLILTNIDKSNPFIKALLVDRVTKGGKMIRPALVIIGAKLGEKEREKDALRLASSLEMIHIASLVHDDIIDKAKTRRGLPTINSLVGPKQAVLAGDFLLSKALSLLNGKEGDLESSSVANAFSRLCESELNQDADVGNFLISSSTYIRRIAGKTASLFALSSYAGAAVTLADKYQQNLLHRIGYCLGMVFQIKDDILDYTGDAVKLGKEIGQDVRSGIPTYPLIAALKEEAKKGENRDLFNLVKRKRPLSKRDANKVVDLVISLGGVEKSEALAQKYIDKALTDIKKLNNREVETQLISLYTKLFSRHT